jgi:hypothetical protein
MDRTIREYGFEAYAALWGCDPVYDRAPNLHGDGYKFYNFSSETSKEFLESFLPAIDRTILSVEQRKTGRDYRKREQANDLESLRALRTEVESRLKTAKYIQTIYAKRKDVVV